MDRLRQFLFRLTGIFRTRRLDVDMSAELQAHLELRIERNIENGMTPDEARHAAMRSFGGMEQIKERCRDERSARWIETILQDLRFGTRSLRRSPGFTVAALATIAIGIGANTAIFSYVNGVLLKGPAYPDADRIVAIVEKPPTSWWSPISTLTYLDWAKQNTVFEYMTTLVSSEVALTGIEFPVNLLTQNVSAHYFDIFRIRPALGRAFLDGEDQPGHDLVVVLTNKVWVSRFGADPNVIGRKIILDRKPTTVVGVMPPGVLDRSWAEIYRPLVFAPDQMSRTPRWLLPAYALLKPGVTLEQARADMDLIGAQIARECPETNKGWGVNTMPYAGTLVWDDLRHSLHLLMAAVGAVLLIGCVNLANLTLARGMAREREVAVRAALGAGRFRLVRQFLTESLLLSFGGGALGLLVGYWGIAALRKAPPGGSLPATFTVEIDGRVLIFAFGLTLFTALIFGLIPALRASRLDLTSAIKQGSSGTSQSGVFQRIRGLLIVAQVAMAFVLLSGSGLLIRSFFRIQRADAGFESANAATAYLPIPNARFSSGDALNVYLDQILDRIKALPGVSDVALTTAPPVNWGGGHKYPFRIGGQKALPVADRPSCIFKVVTSSYFRTLGMRLTEGRFLDSHDLRGATPATVISESMAKKYFPNDIALGQHIYVANTAFDASSTDEIPWEIVGIVKDEKNDGLRDEGPPAMYVTKEQSPVTWQFLVVRSAINPVALEHSMRVALRQLDGEQVMDNLITLDQVKANSMAGERSRASLLAVFAIVALLLGAIGLYGVISYSVVQRTREIGIRSALGASPQNIVGLVLRNGMKLTVSGIAIGFVGAIGVSHLIASLLFGVGKYDPVTLAAVGGILVLTALFACSIPARRAAKVDPALTLRAE